jgi:hypothetical protein
MAHLNSDVDGLARRKYETRHVPSPHVLCATRLVPRLARHRSALPAYILPTYEARYRNTKVRHAVLSATSCATDRSLVVPIAMRTEADHTSCVRIDMKGGMWRGEREAE